MIAVLSPAKTLDYAKPIPAVAPTEPRFATEAAGLAASAANLSQKRLAELMAISRPLAKLNADRFAGFGDAPHRPAIFAFAGDVYTGFEARTVDEAGIAFAQDHLRLLSGLYGLLRPLDAMRPYRLEMGTRWAPRRKSLYDWWGNRIADLLAHDVAEEGSGVVLNLASQEYWAAVAGKLPQAIRVVQVDFREPGPDGPRFISFNAKRARGMMARWLCEHRVSDIDAMKSFDTDGYRFDAAESNDTQWRFMRDAA
ncbi:MAG: peroxide stress protein YaaA [Pseudomonadota bacterium]|uniref:peroxide stress protein YaaA n=1 Tax=Sphingomonas sp. ERG5 TaxID=1381597 RepID=UPI00054C35C4|nr:peroxide stress protein YaaA [Sphingomonas sp. ERG5]